MRELKPTAGLVSSLLAEKSARQAYTRAHAYMLAALELSCLIFKSRRLFSPQLNREGGKKTKTKTPPLGKQKKTGAFISLSYLLGWVGRFLS